MRMNDRVICAALRHRETGQVIIGIRHFDLFMLRQIDDMKGSGWAQAEQGFIDQHGTFLDRKEAREMAAREGQIIRRCRRDSEELFSENLY